MSARKQEELMAPPPPIPTYPPTRITFAYSWRKKPLNYKVTFYLTVQQHHSQAGRSTVAMSRYSLFSVMIFLSAEDDKILNTPRPSLTHF